MYNCFWTAANFLFSSWLFEIKHVLYSILNNCSTSFKFPFPSMVLHACKSAAASPPLPYHRHCLGEINSFEILLFLARMLHLSLPYRWKGVDHQEAGERACSEVGRPVVQNSSFWNLMLLDVCRLHFIKNLKGNRKILHLHLYGCTLKMTLMQ